MVDTGAPCRGAYNVVTEPVLSAWDVGTTVGWFPLVLPRRLLAAMAWAKWRVGLQPIHPGWLTLADRTSLVDADRARLELGWRPRLDARPTLAGFAHGLRRGAGTASHPLAPRHELTMRTRIRRVDWGTPGHQRA